VLLQDIKKVLKKLSKAKKLTDPKIKLPIFYHNKINLKIFSPEIISQGYLLPYCPDIDHAIKLEKDKHGREKVMPWGLLYNISKEELLVF
jgi:hypothetical protein